MRIRPFQYYAPVSLNGALAKLAELGPDAKILAGGTDLILSMKYKVNLPSWVIDLNKVEELDFIEERGSRLHIGSLATHSTISKNKTLRNKAPILCQAVSMIGSWQIRNVATIGGNLCNASPAADSAPPLLALDARVIIADVKGENEIPLREFFTGPGVTAMQPNQLLKEIIIEQPGPWTAGCYLKLMRKKAVDLSVVGVAFQGVANESEGKLSRVAISLGGVAPTPIRSPGAEAVLNGLEYREALKALPDAAQAAVADTSPIDDIRASAEYRKAVVNAYVKRAGAYVISALMEKGGERT